MAAKKTRKPIKTRNNSAPSAKKRPTAKAGVKRTVAKAKAPKTRATVPHKPKAPEKRQAPKASNASPAGKPAAHPAKPAPDKASNAKASNAKPSSAKPSSAKPSKAKTAPAQSSPGNAALGKLAPAKSSPGKATPTKSSPGKLSGAKPNLRDNLRPSKPPLREAPPRLVAVPLPILAAPRRPSVEERAASIETRLAAATDDFRKRYEDSLDMSWIYHDSALEGVVYTFEELRTALSGQAPPVTDSSLQPTYDDIRRHKEAIEFVRDYGLRKKLPVTVDIIKKVYLILHPEEGDIKTVKYRKDIPQHRLYFHEYAPPDKIAYKVRQIVDWLNDPETRKTRNGVRIAARAHYDLLRVYPFPTDSGKVSRLFMNLLLMRTGLPPAIVHSTERQRYYEALKGSATTVLQMVQESVENALSSVEKLLDEHESRKRAFVS